MLIRLEDGTPVCVTTDADAVRILSDDREELDWLERGDLCARTLVAACRALGEVQSPVPYRPGLPTIEQVRAHNRAHGGWWQFLCEGEEGPSMVKLRWEDHDGDSSLIVGRRAGRIEFACISPPAFCRPVTFPDGTPCAWSDR